MRGASSPPPPPTSVGALAEEPADTATQVAAVAALAPSVPTAALAAMRPASRRVLKHAHELKSIIDEHEKQGIPAHKMKKAVPKTNSQMTEVERQINRQLLSVVAKYKEDAAAAGGGVADRRAGALVFSAARRGGQGEGGGLLRRQGAS